MYLPVFGTVSLKEHDHWHSHDTIWNTYKQSNWTKTREGMYTIEAIKILKRHPSRGRGTSWSGCSVERLWRETRTSGCLPRASSRTVTSVRSAGGSTAPCTAPKIENITKIRSMNFGSKCWFYFDFSSLKTSEKHCLRQDYWHSEHFVDSNPVTR